MSVSAPTADFQTTTLNGAITAIATSMTIGVGLNIPATNGVLQIDYDSSQALGAASGPETIFYTSYTSGTGAISGMTRGVAGTTGVTHANGCNIQYGHSAYWYGQGMIQNTDLSTSAIKLGYAANTTNFSTSSTTAVQITGLTSTVTIPAGGRSVKITAFIPTLYTTGTNNTTNLSIWDGTVNVGTLLNSSTTYCAGLTIPETAICIAVVSPGPGSKTYNVGLSINTAGTANIQDSATSPAFILVELI